MLFMLQKWIVQKVKHQWKWMLLTTEVVTDAQMTATVLRWYSYRWRVEEYHKILKSGCQVERYRLAANSMKTLLGFNAVIAVELLQLTYLHRSQPDLAAIEILNPLQLKILKAKSPLLPKVLTVSWALGGYCSFRWLLGASTSNSNWYSGTVARLVKITRPLRGLAAC
jgi:hypothetical protein